MNENLALSENGFLFDTRTGSTYSLNRTGTFLLRHVIDGASRASLAERLVATFEVRPEVAERDVAQFLFRLKELRVVDIEEA